MPTLRPTPRTWTSPSNFTPPPARGSANEDSTAVHRVHHIRNVIFITDYHQGQPVSDAVAQAEEIQRDKEGYITVYGDDHYIKPSVLIEKCFITPGSRYNSAMVDRTYEYMSQLGIIRSINIELQPVSTDDDNTELDAYILLIRNRKQSVAFEVEGTNSEGDLGFGVGVTYQHRNLFHGSQLFTAKFRSSTKAFREILTISSTSGTPSRPPKSASHSRDSSSRFSAAGSSTTSRQAQNWHCHSTTRNGPNSHA